MFDSLKKKLKEAVEKVSKTIKEEKVPKEELKRQEEERKKEKEDRKIIEDIDKDVEAELVEEQIYEKIEKEKEYEEYVEKVAGEEMPAELRPEAEIKAETKEELPTPVVEEKKKPGFLARILEKELTEKDVQLVLKELQLAMLENDVALEVVERISDDIKKELTGKYVRKGKIEDAIKHALRNAMLDVLRQEKMNLDEMIKKKDGPFTIVFLGFNGTGKSTTIAKFAHRFKNYSPIIAAADTFRAASIEQLEVHAQRIGVRLVKHKYGADAAAVIFDAKKAALAAGTKLVLADTAGRSHANVNLMDELKKIVRVNSPDLKILVLDAITGNDIFEQCRMFNEAVDVDAIVLTKADVYDKGGAALSASYTIKKPILYLGTGQEYDDLKEFNAEEIVNNLLK
jgi:fused signal recognition particle receptor